MLVNLKDFEEAAAGALPKAVFDYYAGGARDELTVGENRRAFERLRLRFRVMRGVAQRDLSTVVLGQAVSMPVLIAPTALQCLSHPDGELATMRAAAAEGVVMTVSTMSNHTLEDIAAVGDGPHWFQVYIYKDRSVTEDMIRRAEVAGYGALVLTVDTPIVGGRERDARNAFAMPDGVDYANFRAYGASDMAVRGLAKTLGQDAHDPFESGLVWDDLRWMCDLSDLPVLVKGLVHPEDVEPAIEAGAAGIIVSNHGGRQLDGAIPAIEALPAVVAAAKGRVEVLMDGGVRRGTDVIKALAFGARAVLLGRPILWGLAVDGEPGVRSLLDLLRRELDMDMALAGFRSVDEIRTLGPSSIVPRV